MPDSRTWPKIGRWTGPSSPPQWKRLGRRNFEKAETLLRSWEPYCVSACARFLAMDHFTDYLWGHWNIRSSADALLLSSKQTLLPVFPAFNNADEIRLPRAMLRFLRKNRFHAVQGLRKDLLIMERIMSGLGKESIDPIDYDLMALDWRPSAEALGAGPAGLSVRTPDFRELENILPLQAAYEREEVLPQGSTFNMAACRLNLEHILREQQILVAELGKQIIAKANTSALSFTRAQIGGVFVRPEYRGLGIARRLCAELAGDLKRSGWDLSLFVKKRNHSAQRVYRSIGFRPIADYRISYYL
jgi:predicted GNAT family acetyltransferase